MRAPGGEIIGLPEGNPVFEALEPRLLLAAVSDLGAYSDSGILGDGAGNPQAAGVLLISSTIDEADVLAEAAEDDVIVIRYDAQASTLDSLLQRVAAPGVHGLRGEYRGIERFTPPLRPLLRGWDWQIMVA